MNDELPAHVEVAITRIRGSKKGFDGALNRLLERWKEGDLDERRRVEKLILELAKPSRVGLFVGGFLGIVGAILGSYFYSEFALTKKVEGGERAVAKVTRLSEGFCVLGAKGSRCLDFELEVHPVGRSPFNTKITRDLSETWISRVQPGNWVTVALDAKDPSVVYLNEKAFEEAPPSPPSSGNQ